MARTSSTIGSCHVMLGLQEFFRGTNDRGLIALRPAYVFNVATDGRVGNVRAVPGQQVCIPFTAAIAICKASTTALVGRGPGAMKAWASPAASSLRVSSGMPCRAAIRRAAASGSPAWDRRGNKQVETCPLCLPPLRGNLLVGRGDQVTIWPCGEIADDSCFEVDFGVHGWTLYNLGLGVKVFPHARWAERLAAQRRGRPHRRSLTWPPSWHAPLAPCPVTVDAGITSPASAAEPCVNVSLHAAPQ